MRFFDESEINSVIDEFIEIYFLTLSLNFRFMINFP